ncbi:hypothetical protein AMTRI_Chr02g258480 [Amborella trichopoda]
MGKVAGAESRKKKKEGRPSLVVLQRCRHPPPPPPPTYSLRNRNRPRTRRSYHDLFQDEEDDDDDDEEECKREKKLKLVLRLPRSYDHNNRSQSPSASSASSQRVDEAALTSGPDSGVSSSDEFGCRDKESLRKRRKLHDGENGFPLLHDDGSLDPKEEKNQDTPDADPGPPSDSSSATPLPDTKLLEGILDKLQKKDTYSVFAEPVDPEELPDYHDVIQHPMDFGTIRKKLAAGDYSILEQLEGDVILICTNAMQYNAPDTIYFKQAHSIKELARKKFHELKVDHEGAKIELKAAQEVKDDSSIRKPLKKSLSRSTLEHAGSDFSSGATLATAGDISNLSNILQPPASEQAGNGSCFGDGNSTLADSFRIDKTEELSVRGLASRFGRRPTVFDENRRGAYKLSNQQPEGPSELAFTLFQGDMKQLMLVGLQAEHGYARSLARFAANLGPTAWKIASRRIEEALPTGLKFGPGWVGEDEVPVRPLLPSQSQTQTPQANPSSGFHTLSSQNQTQTTQSKPVSVFRISSSQNQIQNTQPKTDSVSHTLTSQSQNQTTQSKPSLGLLSQGQTQSTQANRSFGLASQSQTQAMLSSGMISHSQPQTTQTKPSGSVVLPSQTHQISQTKPSSGLRISPSQSHIQNIQTKPISAMPMQSVASVEKDVSEIRQRLHPMQVLSWGGHGASVREGSLRVPNSFEPQKSSENSVAVTKSIAGAASQNQQQQQQQNFLSMNSMMHGGNEYGRSQLGSNNLGSTLPSNVLKQGEGACSSPSADGSSLRKTNAEAASSQLIEMVPRSCSLLNLTQQTEPSVSLASGSGRTMERVDYKNTMCSSDSIRTTSSSLADYSRNPQTGAANTFIHGNHEMGLQEKVSLMKVLSEKMTNQPIHSNIMLNNSQVGAKGPPLRRDDSGVTAAALAWMSIRGSELPLMEKATPSKIQSVASSLYNPGRESSNAEVNIRSTEKNISASQLLWRSGREEPNLQYQAMASAHQGQAADLFRFQVQSPWRGLSPQTQQKQKRDTLPPDLNLVFQLPSSPVQQSSGVLVDSQQPDLALQL